VKDEIFIFGGLLNSLGGSTTNNAAKYNIINKNWTMIANMPFGVNHAAAGTDGLKKILFFKF